MTATKLRALTRSLGQKSQVIFRLDDGTELQLVSATNEQRGRDGRPIEAGRLVLTFRAPSVEIPDYPPEFPRRAAGAKESPPPGTSHSF